MKPRGRPALTAFVVCLSALAGTGCQDSNSGATSPASSAPTSRTSAPIPTSSASGSRTNTIPRTSAGAEGLALQEQVDLIVGGNGAATDCVKDLESLPPDFAAAPSIWISKAYKSDTPLEYTIHSALCLHGFTEDEPIAVRVRTGTFSASTTVRPAPGTPNLEAYLAPSTLFKRAGELTVYSVGTEVLMSEMWMFAAVAAARSQLARSSRLTLTAEQSDRRAVHQQQVTTPTSPARIKLDGLPADEVSLLVYGFEPGTVVPIGLYVRSTSTSEETAQLVAQVGTVRMPAARVASFTAPKGLLKGRPAGDYCLIVPLAEQDGCPAAGTVQ